MPTRRVIARTPLDALVPTFEAIRSREDVRTSRPPAVEEEAREGGRDEEHDHIGGERADLTDVPFVTIDPRGSRDLDQALHLTPVDGG